jgi:hypothetical protein
MKSLKAIGLTIVLVCATAVPAFADGSCNPGEMQGPPCAVSSSAVTDRSTISADPAALGDMSAPPVTDSVDLVTLGEIAVNLLLAF